MGSSVAFKAFPHARVKIGVCVGVILIIQFSSNSGSIYTGTIVDALIDLSPDVVRLFLRLHGSNGIRYHWPQQMAQVEPDTVETDSSNSVTLELLDLDTKEPRFLFFLIIY